MADMKWYVLRTAGSKEKKAAEHLEKEIERSGLQDQVAQVLVPVKREIVTKNGKRKVVEKLLFPGYVLIQAVLSAELSEEYAPCVNGQTVLCHDAEECLISARDLPARGLLSRTFMSIICMFLPQ